MNNGNSNTLTYMDGFVPIKEYLEKPFARIPQFKIA